MSWSPFLASLGTQTSTTSHNPLTDLKLLTEDYYDHDVDSVEVLDNNLLVCCGNDIIFRSSPNKVTVVTGIIGIPYDNVTETNSKGTLSAQICKKLILSEEVSAVHVQVFETRLSVLGAVVEETRLSVLGSVVEEDQHSGLNDPMVYIHTMYDVFGLAKPCYSEKYTMTPVYSTDNEIFDVFLHGDTISILTQNSVAFGNGDEGISLEEMWRADCVSRATGTSFNDSIIITEPSAVHVVNAKCIRTILTTPSDDFNYKEIFLGATVFQEQLVILTNLQYLVYSACRSDHTIDYQLLRKTSHNAETVNKCLFIKNCVNSAVNPISESLNFVLLSDKTCSYYAHPNAWDENFIMVPSQTFQMEQYKVNVLNQSEYVNLPVDKRLCVTDQLSSKLVSANQMPLGLVVLTDNGDVFLLPRLELSLDRAWSKWINSVALDQHYAFTAVNVECVYNKLLRRVSRFSHVYQGVDEVGRDKVLEDTTDMPDEYSKKLIDLWDWG